VLIFSACFDRNVSNRVKDSCITLINVFSYVLVADIFGISILFPVAWAYVISDLLLAFCGTVGFSYSCLGIFVRCF
jgi:hypothetical protein